MNRPEVFSRRRLWPNLWVLSMFLLPIWYVCGNDPMSVYNHERQALLVLFMSVLSFPSGPAWIFLYLTLTGSVLQASSQMPFYLDLFFVWFGCIVLGFVQWFVLVPKLRSHTTGK